MKRHSVAVELVQLEDRLVQLTSMKEILNHAQTNSMESLRLAIVDRADIICATLAGSGLSIMERIRLGDLKQREIRGSRSQGKTSGIKKPPRRFGTWCSSAKRENFNHLLSLVSKRLSLRSQE